MKISQLSTFIENRSGRLRAACEALAARGINIHTLCLADSRDFGILRLIVADPPAGKAALEAAGYVAQLTDVLAVEVADSAGGLARVLANTGIPVEVAGDDREAREPGADGRLDEVGDGVGDLKRFDHGPRCHQFLGGAAAELQ